MNRSGRLLCALYLATSCGLAWTTFLETLHGPAWAACLFAAASLVPVIAVVRETLIHELRTAAAGPRRPVRSAADEIVREELDAACCERWWTSLGTDHDAACPHRIPRSSAA
ncbi:hypothetical protein ABZ848_21115 [Streptomyces sp. NPDC047081]|uniref:hypothetical protein n=1 Tax=Streptomyces sp. NPDC047081 TaxID=3154706 RepID=UPI0033DC32FA